MKSTLSENLECEVKEKPDLKGTFELTVLYLCFSILLICYYLRFALIWRLSYEGCTDAHLENGLTSVHTPQQKPNIAKTFVGNEILDGKTVTF